MARRGYTTIALPNELVSEIDLVIKSKKRGYSSRAELIKDGVRVILDKLKKLDKKWAFISKMETQYFDDRGAKIITKSLFQCLSFSR